MKKYLLMAAALFMGAAMFTACSSDDDDDPIIIDPVEVNAVINPAAGAESIALNNHSEAIAEAISELIVNFGENSASIRKATYEICSLAPSASTDGTSWSPNETIAKGELSLNNVGYVALEEPIVFYVGEKYQINIKVYDATEKEIGNMNYIINGASDKTATLDFEGDYFTKLIDNPQYNGPLIYSADEYKWVDDATQLSSFCESEDWSKWGEAYAGMFGWSFGIAISNYIDDSEKASYDKQLSVPVSNGSKNFAVVWDNGSSLSFADGSAHIIKSMDVCLTTYTLRNVQSNCGEGYEYKTIANATLADGSTKAIDIVLASGRTAVDNWKTVSLEELGAVKSISFTFDGTDKSNYGVSTPKYFALDNVVVVL
ncbi:MAG: DUF4465 domain-containing protein [Prevotellaceae bacterium]|nr:DUF4465 domain-containing protein [Candidatus Minthosoma caballi]